MSFSGYTTAFDYDVQIYKEMRQAHLRAEKERKQALQAENRSSLSWKGNPLKKFIRLIRSGQDDETTLVEAAEELEPLAERTGKLS